MFEGVNLITIFLTGLLTGGLTCLAVQGGLLTSTLAQREASFVRNTSGKQEALTNRLTKRGHMLPILAFLLSKLVAYTLFGFALGWLGSLVQLSLQARIAMQVFVVLFMIGTALNLLNVHPIFRYVVIQPPYFLTRFIRKQSKRTDVFAPAMLGASTVFIPCGVTQAMIALAITTGSPILGALILFVFVLGTSPLFFILGYITMKLGDVLQKQFLRVAAVAILVLAFVNLEATLSLTGTPYTLTNLATQSACIVSYCDDDASESQKAVTEETITFTPTGYSPDTFSVKAGEKVTLHLVNEGAGGCIQAFTIPSLNIEEIVPVNQTKDISFVAPEKAGKIAFTCSMGMYPGTITVL